MPYRAVDAQVSMAVSLLSADVPAASLRGRRGGCRGAGVLFRLGFLVLSLALDFLFTGARSGRVGGARLVRIRVGPCGFGLSSSLFAVPLGRRLRLGRGLTGFLSAESCDAYERDKCQFFHKVIPRIKFSLRPPIGAPHILFD